MILQFFACDKLTQLQTVTPECDSYVGLSVGDKPFWQASGFVLQLMFHSKCIFSHTVSDIWILPIVAPLDFMGHWLWLHYIMYMYMYINLAHVQSCISSWLTEIHYYLSKYNMEWLLSNILDRWISLINYQGILKLPSLLVPGVLTKNSFGVPVLWTLCLSVIPP